MIEVNPRFWSGLDHSIKAGPEFPWLLYQVFIHGHAEPETEEIIGKRTSLPALSTMSRLEKIVNDSLNFEEFSRKWPEISEHFRNAELKDGLSLFQDALSGTVSIDEAVATFRELVSKKDEISKITYAEDDPFIGLGVLFVFAFLIRHGELPPELRRP